MTYDPYANSFPAPSFEVTLADVGPDGVLPDSAWAERGNKSPAVQWETLPVGTRSLMVTAFDPDAPIPGGFWHWLVQDVAADSDGLPVGAGVSDESLPGRASHKANGLGLRSYGGVNPPPGTGTHRLFVCVTALDVDHLEVPEDAGPSMLHIAAIGHTLGRGLAIATSTASSG